MHPDDSHGTNDGLSTNSTEFEPINRGGSGYRNTSLDNTTYMLVLLIVLIPIIFTVLLCAVTYCIYRYNRTRTNRAPTNAAIVPTDRSGASIATVVYNTQHSPYTYEESPPSYDSLGNMKKDFVGMPTINTSEQVQLTTLPNIGLTNSASVLYSSASAPPPPSYNNLQESNQ